MSQISPTSHIEAIKRAAIEKHGLEIAHYLAFWGNYPPNQKTCWWKIYKHPPLTEQEREDFDGFVDYCDNWLSDYGSLAIIYPEPPIMWAVLLQPFMLNRIPF